MTRVKTVLVLLFMVIGISVAHAEVDPQEMFVGRSKGKLTREYPKAKARTYRQSDQEEWMTFNYPKGVGGGMITFHFQDGKVVEAKLNDRSEVVTEYLSEFSSPAFGPDSKTYAALRDALIKIPQEDFLSVTDRARPVIFTEYHYAGIGRFANSSNIISFKDDAPSMMDGLTMIKISLEMEDTAGSSQEIEGVILHELAHRVLEHAKKKIRTCQMEREANNLVKFWGYEEVYLKAKDRFGDKTRTDAQKCPE